MNLSRAIDLAAKKNNKKPTWWQLLVWGGDSPFAPWNNNLSIDRKEETRKTNGFIMAFRETYKNSRTTPEQVPDHILYWNHIRGEYFVGNENRCFKPRDFLELIFEFPIDNKYHEQPTGDGPNPIYAGNL